MFKKRCLKKKVADPVVVCSNKSVKVGFGALIDFCDFLKSHTFIPSSVNQSVLNVKT